MTLAEWMKAQKVTDAWLAKRVGRERTLITRLRNGTGQPSLEVAVAIEGVTNGAVRPIDLIRPDLYPKPEREAAA